MIHHDRPQTHVVGSTHQNRRNLSKDFVVSTPDGERLGVLRDEDVKLEVKVSHTLGGVGEGDT